MGDQVRELVKDFTDCWNSSPGEFGDCDKLGQTGYVDESREFMNMMILVIQVNLLIMVNVAKLVIFFFNIVILMIQVNFVYIAIF